MKRDPETPDWLVVRIIGTAFISVCILLGQLVEWG